MSVEVIEEMEVGRMGARGARVEDAAAILGFGGGLCG